MSMHIVASLWSAPPHRVVGGEMMTLRLLQHSLACGHDVGVLAQTFTNPASVGAVRIVPGHVAPDPRALDELNRANVVVTHPEIAYWAYRMTRRVMRIPMIGIVHNLNATTLRAISHYQSMHLVANSMYVADRLRQEFPSRDVTVIYPPAVPPPAPAPGLPHEFCTMINLSAEKGGDLFNALVLGLPDRPFIGVLGGHGEQIVPNPLPDNLTLMMNGPVGLAMHLTKLLVTPSHSETYNMTACEALMLGTPVIASDLPAHRESVGDGALLLPVDDTLTWEHEVKRAFDDVTELRERADRFRAILKERLIKTYEDWDDLLERVV